MYRQKLGYLGFLEGWVLSCEHALYACVLCWYKYPGIKRHEGWWKAWKQNGANVSNETSQTHGIKCGICMGFSRATLAFDARSVRTYRQMHTHTSFILSTTTQFCSDFCLSYSRHPRSCQPHYCQHRNLSAIPCYRTSRQTTIACHRKYVQTDAHSYTFQILFNITALFWLVSSRTVCTPAVVSHAACQDARVPVHHAKRLSPWIGRTYRQIHTHTPFWFCTTSQFCPDFYLLTQWAIPPWTAPHLVSLPALPVTMSSNDRVTLHVRIDRCTFIHLSDFVQHHSSVLTCFFSYSRHPCSRQKCSLSHCPCCRSPRQATLAWHRTSDYMAVLFKSSICKCTYKIVYRYTWKHRDVAWSETRAWGSAMASYQRQPSSPRKREGNVRFPTDLHGEGRSARSTSRWAPKAHRMMGKTQ